VNTIAKEKRTRDTTWDFLGENSKVSIHGIHTYPAMMIPQIAKRLIEEYGRGSRANLDPFCGSGTVLVESLLHGISSYGVDINPLAILLSKVKTTPISPSLLKGVFEGIRDKITDAQYNPRVLSSVEIPDFFNIDYWFKPKVIKELAYIKEIISGIDDERIRNFFYVAFSETVRKVSNTRGGEFKLFRMPQEKLKSWNPDTFSVFLGTCERDIGMMKEFYSSLDTQRVEKGELYSQVLSEDMRYPTSVPKKSIDFIATSPPYGDSRTTVAYGQFSRLALQWLGYDYDIVKNIDKSSLGGVRPAEMSDDVGSPTLSRTLNKISKEDEKRALDVYSFFLDFNKAVQEMDRVLTNNATVCMVVGNRTVKKVSIPTDIIITELFEEKGFEHIKTIVRAIPTKRLPKRGSPSNVAGDSVSTMNFEYIVIMRRE